MIYPKTAYLAYKYQHSLLHLKIKVYIYIYIYLLVCDNVGEVPEVYGKAAFPKREEGVTLNRDENKIKFADIIFERKTLK